jgi:hypothetical protein
VCTPLLGDALFASNAVAYIESVHSREFAGDGVSSQLADLHVKMVDWQVKVGYLGASTTASTCVQQEHTAISLNHCRT